MKEFMQKRLKPLGLALAFATGMALTQPACSVNRTYIDNNGNPVASSLSVFDPAGTRIDQKSGTASTEYNRPVIVWGDDCYGQGWYPRYGHFGHYGHYGPHHSRTPIYSY